MEKLLNLSTNKVQSNEQQKEDSADNGNDSMSESHEFELAWYDSLMDAGHWFSRENVASAEAILLLCGFDPNEEILDGVRSRLGSPIGGDNLARMERRFIYLESTKQKTRSLLDWIRYAKAEELVYDAWVDRYLELSNAPMESHVERLASQPDGIEQEARPHAKRYSAITDAWEYIQTIYREKPQPTAKALFQELERRANKDDSPFEKQGAQDHFRLVLINTGCSFSLKTLQNRWGSIKK